MRFLFHLLSTCLLTIGLLACSENKSSDSSSQPSAATETDSGSVEKKRKTILFFGNSLTAGYGLDPSEAFSALIQNRLDSLNLPYKVVNAGVSGETTSGGNSRIEWVLRQPVDIFILELGGNDGLRGVPIAETRKNLQEIIDKVRAKYPDVTIILAGMQVPPNMGRDYATEFKALYTDLSAKNNTKLIPFLLEGVGGEPSLNLPDGIHPTAKGHTIVAENVWEILEGEL
ncbi:arylesterase [Arundinibacter roseus]|uniref:Arylesterase n=1 Tax=Arundinibacter roseus TaxID=2070510 RepID=A0A4R4K0I0_9BACT|nr:arylesterase [Arundinibacter roseus]TDB59811.1 arylesterase [Arundinibacter roseus]